MTIQIISANVLTVAADDHAVDIAASGDLVIVQAGVVAAAEGANAHGIDDNGVGNVGIEVSGTVVSESDTGIRAGTPNDGATGSNVLTITATGSVFASSFGVLLHGGNNRITNAGTVTAGTDGLLAALSFCPRISYR